MQQQPKPKAPLAPGPFPSTCLGDRPSDSGSDGSGAWPETQCSRCRIPRAIVSPCLPEPVSAVARRLHIALAHLKQETRRLLGARRDQRPIATMGKAVIGSGQRSSKSDATHSVAGFPDCLGQVSDCGRRTPVRLSLLFSPTIQLFSSLLRIFNGCHQFFEYRLP